MTPLEIRKTWRKLLMPFCIGIAVLIAGILWHRLGRKTAGPQTYSLFMSILGIVMIALPGYQMLRFRKYLKRNKPL